MNGSVVMEKTIQCPTDLMGYVRVEIPVSVVDNDEMARDLAQAFNHLQALLPSETLLHDHTSGGCLPGHSDLDWVWSAEVVGRKAGAFAIWHGQPEHGIDYAVMASPMSNNGRGETTVFGILEHWGVRYEVTVDQVGSVRRFTGSQALEVET